MIDVHSSGKRIQPEAISKLIIGGQTGADAIRFIFKEFVSGVDLTNPAFSWFLQFRNKYGTGSHVALAPPVQEDGVIKLIWVPDLLATQVPGKMEIQIYSTVTEGEGAEAVITTRWVSEAAVIYVQENLQPDPVIPTELSIFDHYLVMYQSFKEAAENAADAAFGSEEAAAGSESNAHDSEVAARESAQAAATSESNAHDSEEAAAGSALAAATSESNAHDSEEAAAGSALAAATSESNAHDSEEAAAGSALAAATSESNAHDSEEAAAGSALAAATSESNAHDSEEAAAGSALAAATSESNAHDSEVAALQSAQAAMAADAAANKQLTYDGTLYQYSLKQAAKPGFIAISFEEVI